MRCTDGASGWKEGRKEASGKTLSYMLHSRQRGRPRPCFDGIPSEVWFSGTREREDGANGKANSGINNRIESDEYRIVETFFILYSQQSSSWEGPMSFFPARCVGSLSGRMDAGWAERGTGGKGKSFFRIIPFSCVSDGAVFALALRHETIVVLLSKKMNQKSGVLGGNKKQWTSLVGRYTRTGWRNFAVSEENEGRVGRGLGGWLGRMDGWMDEWMSISHPLEWILVVDTESHRGCMCV